MKIRQVIIVGLVLLLVQGADAADFSTGSSSRRLTAANLRRKSETSQSSTTSVSAKSRKVSTSVNLDDGESSPSKGGSSLVPEGFGDDDGDSKQVKGQAQKVLSAEGLAVKDNIKVEYGEGHGETSDEALKEAMKDVLQKVVGVYVDSDFRMNNDKIIKDEIITHSNGFIDHYKKMEESDDPNGRGKVVTIKAWVKVRDFVNRMKKMTPKQVVKMDGLLLDNDVSNKANAEALLKKEIGNLNPIMDLMEVSLVEGIKPTVIKSTDEAVTLRYVFQIRYSKKRYYQEFIPRLCKVMDQIAMSKRRDRSLQLTVEKADFVPVGDIVSIGTGWHGGCGWKEKQVSGYLFSIRKGHYRSERSSVAAMTKVNSGGSAIVCEWTLSDRLMEIYSMLRKDIRERSKEVSCALKLYDAEGGIVSQGDAEIVWECLVLNSSWAAIDFRPLIWNSRYVSGIDARQSDWQDRYVGYVDLGVDRGDVSKIKSAEITLETNSQGENE